MNGKLTLVGLKKGSHGHLGCLKWRSNDLDGSEVLSPRTSYTPSNGGDEGDDFAEGGAEGGEEGLRREAGHT